MSSRVDHRAAEMQAGLFDLSFLYGLKNGPKRDVIDFCMKMDLIAKEYVCPSCNEKMELSECSTLEDGFIWCCRKYGQNAHHIKRSVRKGSWFECSHLSMPEVLIFTYLFVKKTSNEWIVDELNVSEPTVVDWKSFCREVCVDMIIRGSKKLGGVGHVVEIDESKFGKRKYHKETLIEITKKYVQPGTTVLSDCWKSYRPLTEEGYVHYTVNHSVNFKDPITGVHTNGIEGTWSAIKAQFRSQGTKKVKDEFDSYLGEYMWRRLYGGATLKGLFPCFLRGITVLYKPQTRDSPK
ncbi:hypothetical protein AVEN_29382-1 [Araneus ventricosus]|uniref:ISXO2-like transposase domain-containing protein n=1 Tax=Araneus ventricosus TaxID=182803 RepID=A0A4Y2JY64_ARAVE|nr:hypothetical protein AVEN_29382-1 [Araneus ventricosus]